MRYQLWKFDGQKTEAVVPTDNRALHPWVTATTVDGHQVIGFITKQRFDAVSLYKEALLLSLTDEETMCFGWRGDIAYEVVLSRLREKSIRCILVVIELSEQEEDALYENPDCAATMFEELLSTVQELTNS